MFFQKISLSLRDYGTPDKRRLMYGDTENQKLQGPTVIEGFPYVFFFKLKNIFLEFLVKISSLYLEKWLSYFKSLP